MKRFALLGLVLLLGVSALAACKVPRPPPVPGPIQPPPPPGTLAGH